MAIEIATPIPVFSETPEGRERRIRSTIKQYAKAPCERQTWDDINEGLHEQAFNRLFAALDERGMIKNGMVALFFGSHEGCDVRFFERFVNERGYHSVRILALELADRYSNVGGVSNKVPGVGYIRGDAVYPPLVPESVDLIIDRLAATYTSFRYYPESGPQILAETHRILRIGGSLILDGGNLIKVGRINTWGSSATQIENSHPQLFQQMKDGDVRLVGTTNNRDYRFWVEQFNVVGIPNEWGQVEFREGSEGWLHYQLTKVSG